MLRMLKRELIELDINGEIKTVVSRPADTLLYILREELQLTGAKPGCENGDCDTCTVLMDGLPVKACLILAVETIGHKIITIEGLKSNSVQNAFLNKFAYQCGYCTPGFIMTCSSLVNLKPNANDETVEEWLESNTCRCTGYKEIKDAMREILNSGKQKNG